MATDDDNTQGTRGSGMSDIGDQEASNASSDSGSGTDSAQENVERAAPSESESDAMSMSSDDSELDFGDVSDDADGDVGGSVRRGVMHYTVVGVHTTFEEALSQHQVPGAFRYAYLTRYESRRRHVRVYECRSHVACGNRVKIASVADVDGVITYEVSEAGVHSERATVSRQHGIHPRLRQEVDAMLNVGWSGGALRTLLQLRYRNDAATLRLIPTARQLTNRKAHLMRNALGGWVITDFATFNAWASSRMCTTRATFDEVVDAADPRMDELLVLDTFHLQGEPTTFGTVVTSRRIFRNIVVSVQDQGAELVIATDGTYKLDYAGWTLIPVGTIRTRWVRDKQTQEFIPWLYVFVRSESSAAYHRAFVVACEKARSFLDVDLNVAFATLDHSEPIAAALEQAWPDARLLTCWPHVARQTRRKRVLLSDPELYDSVIKPSMDLLQAARSHEQFTRMAAIITKDWIEMGEHEYASWFRAVYLTRRWDRWHINGAGVPGVTPNQNPIESHHRVIKRTCSPSSRASTTGVLTQIIPRILKYDGDNLCPTSAGHVCSGPLIPEMIAKAKRLVANAKNYRRVFRGKGRHRRLVGLLFNSKRYIVELGNVLASPVTEARARRFAASLEGRIADELTPSELRFEVLSLHGVQILGRSPTEPFELPAVWEGEDVTRVKEFVRCTCKAHVLSGWVCSHVLATLSVFGLLDLDEALARVPVRRAPGRPPARGGALVTEEAQEGYFNVDRLTRLFVRRPGQPMGWKVLDDFEVRTSTTTEISNFVGAVVGFRLDQGVWLWTANFDAHDYRDYEAAELARVVNRAHIAGVDVTH